MRRLLNSGWAGLLDGQSLVFVLAPVLGPIRDLLLLRMALAGNFREWPGDFTFGIPWVVALGTFAAVTYWLWRPARPPGEDAEGET